MFGQPAQLSAPDSLGTAAAVSGDTIVAGAPWANSEQGAVYVFTEPAHGWAGDNRAAKLTAPHGAAGDFFGFSVAIHGDTVVARAPVAMVGANAGQGAVYLFTEPAGGCADETQAAKLTVTDGSGLGTAVAISGDTVLAGAPDATVGSTPDQPGRRVCVRQRPTLVTAVGRVNGASPRSGGRAIRSDLGFPVRLGPPSHPRFRPF
jgi:hypothetical protein